MFSIKNSIVSAILSMATLVATGQTTTPAQRATGSNAHPTRTLFRDSLPLPTAYVNDYEHIFSDKEEQTLDSLIGAFRKRTTIEIAVVTLDTTMVAADSLDRLTDQIGTLWGVGSKGKNNGIVIGLSKGHRRIRISTASGIQKILPDPDVKKIIDTSFIPFFRKRKYYEGTYNGLLTLMKALENRSK